MSRRRGAEASRRRQSRFRHPLVKRDGFHGPKRLPSTSCPLGTGSRRHLDRGPATGSRVLPPETGFRRSFALRYDEEGLDPAAFASSSLASARRHAPLVDFCNRNEPQARPANRRNPSSQSCPSFRWSTDTEERFVSPFQSDEAELSRVRGWNGFAALAASSPSSSRRACARRELGPNPIGSDTSCRGPVTSVAGVANLVGRVHPAIAPLSRSHRPRDALARAAREGPPPAPFREEGYVPPHPRCLPSPKLPSGEGPCPQTVPSLWSGGRAPLQSSRTPFHRRNEEGERGLDHIRLMNPRVHATPKGIPVLSEEAPNE